MVLILAPFGKRTLLWTRATSPGSGSTSPWRAKNRERQRPTQGCWCGRVWKSIKSIRGRFIPSSYPRSATFVFFAILSVFSTGLTSRSEAMAPSRVDESAGTLPKGKTTGQATGESDNGRKGIQFWSKDHDIVLRTFRILIADLCQQFNGGHPGGAIGMAAIGVALWKYVMRYAPHTPDYFNRDRFILSNGHTCLFQYTFLHLTGYKAMTFDQLKSYHSTRVDALCPGHPEIEIEGVEVTTGPLGQGVANAVGLAVATKNLAATYNRPGFDVVRASPSRPSPWPATGS
ncbi:hypothetical protein VTK73DRAFT_7573 [Phialemonium thermophilum]|uniref:Transketolase N-terminal domain-containing protein n=1 Tax=Phialemonium thermophilum TaxID=223376 RepID=A0ABR3WDI0_9PEZI